MDSECHRRYCYSKIGLRMHHGAGTILGTFLVGEFIMGESLAIKNSCFMWLCIKTRFTLGKTCRRKGFIGPGICSLCHEAEETLNHMLGSCKFFHTSWNEMCWTLQLQSSWKQEQFVDNIKHWFALNGKQKFMISFLLWEVWKARNACIFQDTITPPFRVCIRTLASFKD